MRLHPQPALGGWCHRGPDRWTGAQSRLAWLRADLAHWKKQAASANGVERDTAARKLAHWLEDSDLTGVREAKPLEALPAEDREKWQKLLADVEATLAQKPTPRGEK